MWFFPLHLPLKKKNSADGPSPDGLSLFRSSIFSHRSSLYYHFLLGSGLWLPQLRRRLRSRRAGRDSASGRNDDHRRNRELNSCFLLLPYNDYLFLDNYCKRSLRFELPYSDLDLRTSLLRPLLYSNLPHLCFRSSTVKSTNTGAIAGGVSVAAVAVIAGVLGFLFLRRRKQRNSEDGRVDESGEKSDSTSTEDVAGYRSIATFQKASNLMGSRQISNDVPQVPVWNYTSPATPSKSNSGLLFFSLQLTVKPSFFFCSATPAPSADPHPFLPSHFLPQSDPELVQEIDAGHLDGERIPPSYGVSLSCRVVRNRRALGQTLTRIRLRFFRTLLPQHKLPLTRTRLRPRPRPTNPPSKRDSFSLSLDIPFFLVPFLSLHFYAHSPYILHLIIPPVDPFRSCLPFCTRVALFSLFRLRLISSGKERLQIGSQARQSVASK